MKTLHTKKGEYIFLMNKTTGIDDYKMLLLEFEDKKQVIEVGLFDCTHEPDPNMEIITFGFGKRQAVFGEIATLNALKSEFHGINFAISAVARYFIENDYLRQRREQFARRSEKL